MKLRVLLNTKCSRRRRRRRCRRRRRRHHQRHRCRRRCRRRRCRRRRRHSHRFNDKVLARNSMQQRTTATCWLEVLARCWLLRSLLQ